jgi:ribosomal protein L44E
MNEIVLTTIEQAVRLFCPACQKWRMHEMTDCTIDVDLQDSAGTPATIGYKCQTCGRTIRQEQKWGTFTIKAEVKNEKS